MAVENARVSVYITHPEVSELKLTLISGIGTTDDLFAGDGTGADLGSSTADADRTIWADSAAEGIWDEPTSAPWVGSWRPAHDIAGAFGGEDPDGGTWTLKAVDTGAGNTGTIHAASLFIISEGTQTRYDAVGLPIAIPDDTPGGVTLTFAIADYGDGPGGADTDPGLGIGLIERPSQPGFFRIKVTTLHYPANPGRALPARPARTLAYVADYQDAEVYIPINDSRTAQLSLSTDDPVIATIKPYRTQLHYTYVTPNGAHLVIWGIVTKLDVDDDTERVTVSVVDHSLRLQSHFVRFGKRILNGSDNDDLPNPFNTTGHHHGVGYVPIDAIGVRYLIDEARVTDDQTARGVPDIGLAVGSDDTTHLPHSTTHVLGIKRGRQCWDAITDLLSHQIAPDLELVPHDGDVGVYAKIRFHAHQGSTTPVMLLQDGFFLDNCTANYQPGGKLITTSHVLSDGDKDRVTVADADSEEDYGVYVGWESTSYTGKSTAPLEARGEQIIAAYGRPPDYFTVKLHDDCGLYYLDDFIVGDAVKTQIRRGWLNEALLGDIASVRLKQIDSAGNVVPDIEVRVQVGDTTGSGGDA